MTTITGILSTVCMLIVLVAPRAAAGPDISQIEQGVVRVITQTRRGTSTGTGFIVNSSGLVATNQHVVEGGRAFHVLISGSRSPVQAEVLWKDSGLDLALLRAQGLGGRPVTVSRSPLKKGDDVIALGFPGLADKKGNAVDATVTKGVIGRLFRGSWRSARLGIIQHSAELNPGNSGGPLFDACGSVVGINTQASLSGRIIRDAQGRVVEVMAGQGIFFASRVSELMAVLGSRGERVAANDTPCVAMSEADVETRRQAEEAQQQVQDSSRRLTDALHELGRRVWIVSAFMALGILAVLGLALRRPRERIMSIVGEYAAALSQVLPGRRPPGLKRGIVLSGFTTDGKPLRVRLAGRRFTRQGYGLTIGRAPALVDAALPDERASRRHLRIRWTGDRFEIEDLHSSSGTVLNGQSLEPFRPCPLDAGDVVGVGGLELMVSKA